MKACIIGYGVIGHVHYEVLKHQNVEVVAVCDCDASKLLGLSDTKRYTNYKEMIDTEQFDVVHICTPHFLHAEMVIYALMHNKNVLCEKPLCICEQEISDILEAERQSKAILGVCLQNRYNLSSVIAKEHLKDKKVLSAHGSVSWSRDRAYYESGAWRGKWKTEGGGVLINQALHTLDLLQWICGFPNEVYAEYNTYTLKNDIEVEDTLMAVFRGEANFGLFATNSAAAQLSVMLQFKTEDGELIVTPDSAYQSGQALIFDNNKTFLGKKDYGHGHDSLIRDFYHCVESEAKFWIDGEEGSKVVRLILAAYKSNGKKTTIV